MWFYLIDLVLFLHWAFIGKSSERRSRRVALNAENLEDRRVPSATPLGAEPIRVSAVPTDQFAQVRVIRDAYASIPVEQVNIQNSDTGADAVFYSWGDNALVLGGLAEDEVEHNPDDLGSIYGFNPQPDPPGVGIMEWSWGESSTNPSNDKLTVACSNNLRTGSDLLLA